uniref:Pre-mRNA-splicing factor 18 n=1 Tax=Bartheletia paradoxa TaxID=669517 RepID=A0A2D0XHP9_9BASI|nr:hypothetical protein SPAR05829 [Bartheletia paradoxa]
MDFLKAEIESVKRKATGPPPGVSTSSAPPSKYLRRGEIEKLRIDEEQRLKEEKEQKRKLEKDAKEAAKKKSIAAAVSRSNTGTSTPVTSTPPVEAFNVSDVDCIRRLRAKGQPILLFGESSKERRLRLRALELIEARGEGQQNDFKKALEGMDMEMDLKELERRAGGGKATEKPIGGKRVVKEGEEEGEGPEEETSAVGKGKSSTDGTVADMPLLDLSLVKLNPDKLYPQIYYFLKRLLKEWEDFLNAREDQIKRSTQGKLAMATCVQSKEYIKPLFKTLRQRALASDVLNRMAEIIYYMQKREYQRANDSYLRMSIGNAAWPIGVTMVGIHERAAREKISNDQIAHVLNDETSRKYIQSLKRLMTFAQTRYPPADVSHMMG